MGLRDELKYPQGPFGSVTESCIMNFSSVPFYDVQENGGGFDTVTEPKMPRRSPTRGPEQQMRSREGLLGELGKGVLVFREEIQSTARSDEPNGGRPVQ